MKVGSKKKKKNGKLLFELGNAVLEFNTQRVRFAGTGNIDKCYQAKETELAFEYENDSCIAVNQLKGLINYGPLESYANRSVRLAVLSPRECAADIWRHLNELNKHYATTLKQDKAFLLKYIGFQDVFRCGLNIPNGDDTKRFRGYSLSGVFHRYIYKGYWKPKMTRYDTAYIGLSYVQSINNNEKISIGCSQLFDSEGNGMELYLRPLKDPQIIQKNPYMRSGETCRLMNNLKRSYDESVPLHKLNRIVIHKTTHFTKEEIEGITKGLAGVDNIELLQIQEFSAWRAIRFQNDAATSFPIQRGKVIPLDKDTFLIWTHGSV